LLQSLDKLLSDEKGRLSYALLYGTCKQIQSYFYLYQLKIRLPRVDELILWPALDAILHLFESAVEPEVIHLVSLQDPDRSMLLNDLTFLLNRQFVPESGQHIDLEEETSIRERAPLGPLFLLQ
jgi:hypothetical protein